MIGLLSYLWFTQWDVEVNKLFFAAVSTFEFACELALIIIFLFVYILDKKGM